MSENKKQHFVPKFYLSQFSSTGKSVGLYNLTGEKLIENAPIKGQCYRNFFYGKDLSVEQAFGVIEGEARRILGNLVAGSIPARISQDHLTLVLFIVLQRYRTVYARDEMNGFYSRIVRHIAERQGTPVQEITRVTTSEAVMQAIRLASSSWVLTADLGFKVLRSRSCAFITSDNPVILYNELFKNYDQVSGIGLASKGLLIFYPLSPEILLVLYDRSVYKIGSKQDLIIDIHQMRDCIQLNQLQVLCAKENVFFKNSIDCRLQSALRHKGLRRDEDAVMNVAVSHPGSSQKSELLHTQKLPPALAVDLECVRVLKRAKRFKDKLLCKRCIKVSPIRDQAIVDDLREFESDLDNKLVAPSDVLAFLTRKHGEMPFR